MQQIKVEELPVGYFVTDTYYPSGNVNFMIGQVDLGNSCYGYKDMTTKHIQLVAANPILRATTIDWTKTLKYSGTHSGPYKHVRMNKPHFKISKFETQNIISRSQYELALKAKQQGKDFFIYKVSEVKDVN